MFNIEIMHFDTYHYAIVNNTEFIFSLGYKNLSILQPDEISL